MCNWYLCCVSCGFVLFVFPWYVVLFSRCAVSLCCLFGFVGARASDIDVLLCVCNYNHLGFAGVVTFVTNFGLYCFVMYQQLMGNLWCSFSLKPSISLSGGFDSLESFDRLFQNVIVALCRRGISIGLNCSMLWAPVNLCQIVIFF